MIGGVIPILQMHKLDQRHLRLAQSCSASKQDNSHIFSLQTQTFQTLHYLMGAFAEVSEQKVGCQHSELTPCRAICAACLADLGYLTSWSFLLLWRCRSRVQKNLNLGRTKVSALINLQPNLAERQRSSLGKYRIKSQHGSDELQIT